LEDKFSSALSKSNREDFLMRCSIFLEMVFIFLMVSASTNHRGFPFVVFENNLRHIFHRTGSCGK
jgi:hypothetical protein